MTLTDLETIANVARRVDTNPVALAGRFLGLTSEEQRRVPGWGWAALALGAGVALGFVVKRKLRERE